MFVYLGHKSVLEILRRVSAAKLMKRNRMHVDRLPACPPDARELLSGSLSTLPKPIDVLVSSETYRRFSKDLVYHINSGDFPYGSFMAISNDLAVSSPELLFVQLASKLSLVELVAIGYELCGSYRLDKTCDPQLGFRIDDPLTNVAMLRSYVEKANGMKGVKNASAALRHIADRSASPMETALAMLLSLLQAWRIRLTDASHECSD